MESRTQAKSLQVLLLAWEVHANGGSNYMAASGATRLRHTLTQTPKARNANGAFYWNGRCGASVDHLSGQEEFNQEYMASCKSLWDRQ